MGRIATRKARDGQGSPLPAGSSDAFADLIAAEKTPSPVGDLGGVTVERRPIAEQVSGRILAMIKSGNLKAGDRLPTEQQMGIAFGISRPPLREALKALTLMGVLESRQGGRYTVTDLSPGRLIAPFNMTLSFVDYDPHQHFEARTVVDLEIVRLCTDRASAEERQRILQFAVDGRAFFKDPVAFRLIDIAFHQALGHAARNALLSALAQTLYDIGLDVRRVASAVPGVIPTSVGQHIAIAKAIVAKNPDAAVLAARQHLEHVRDTTIRSMAEVR